MPLRILTLLLLTSTIATAADTDWPQWRGPNRDGHAAPQSLLKQWPEDGPKLVLQFEDAGRGYSACSIVDGKLFSMGSDATHTYAFCIDATTGKPVWKTVVSRTGVGDDYNIGWGGGPRGTCTVDGDDVFVLTDVGMTACLDRATGNLRWNVDLVKTYGGKIPTWGYSESLLVDNNMVLCTPGEENFIVGLDRSSGEKVWASRGVNAPAQYSSIVKATVDDNSYYITASKPGLFGFDSKTGNKFFSDDATGNNVAVIPTPIVAGNLLYHTSDYGAGNTLLSITSEGANTIYRLREKTMQNHHGGVVLVDGVIYGFTKAQGGVWMAQDFKSGESLWEEKIRPNDSGSIAYADGHLYCYNDEDGECFLVRPSREKWDPVGKVALPRKTDLPRGSGAIWAHPVIANGVLYIRDQDLIFGFDIADKN